MTDWAEHAAYLERRDLEERQAAQQQPTYKDTPPVDRPRSIAHLSTTVQVALGHVQRHLDEAEKAPDRQSMLFNIEHARRHRAEAAEHQRKLIAHLRADPKVNAELDALATATDTQVPVGDASS